MIREQRGQLGIFTLLVIGAVSLVVVSVMLLIGLSLVGGVVDGLGQTGEPTNLSATPDPVTGTSVEFEDTSGRQEITAVYNVRDSLGYGIQLNGNDNSFYQSDADVSLSGQQWGVSSWGRINDTDETMTLVSVDGRVLIQYNGTTDEWGAWVYNESTTNSYFLSGTASTPTDYTHLTITGNSSSLTLYRNDTAIDTVARGDSIASQWNATNWNGSIDEVRLFDDYTSTSEQSTLYTNPTGAVTGRDKLGRIMFDEGNAQKTPFYYTGGNVQIQNGERVDGLDGVTLSEGTDYELTEADGTITALANGQIDDAPVVFIDYEYRAYNRVGLLGLTILPSFRIFGVSVLIIPAASVLAVLVGSLIAAVRLADVDLPQSGNSGR